MPEEQTRFEKYLMPDILGFDTLISSYGPRFVFDPQDYKDRKEFPLGKVRYPEKPLTTGIPFGATLLISGPPGAGKTTFALEIARGVMRFEPVVKEVGPDKRKREAPLVFYISPEVTQSRLKEMFSEMGWFDDNDSGLFRTDNPIPDKDTLYTVVPLPDVDRPVPSAEELVNGIFAQITRAISPSEAPHEPKPVIVIVDSITALLKGCATESEERRQTHEILHRLRNLFGKNYLALTILLAEQDFAANPDTRVPSIEDYLAEIVFRLGLKSAPLGRRIRTLEITKSQGVNMILGEHSWEIITNKNDTSRFRHPKIARRVKAIATCGEPTDEKLDSEGKPLELKWGTIAIFSRPTIQNPTNLGADIRPNSDQMWTGTTGLDEMLKWTPEYWVQRRGVSKLKRREPTEKGAIKLGSTTLICGPVGCGKSTICEQFLFEALEAEIRGDATWEKILSPVRNPTMRGPRAVLFTFDRGAHATARGALLERLQKRLEESVLGPDSVNSDEIIKNLSDAFAEFLKRFSSKQQRDERLLTDSLRKDVEALVEASKAPGNIANHVAKELTSAGKSERKFSEPIKEILRPFFDHLLDDWFAVLDFTQSNFDYNTLNAHALWVRDWWKPDRMAFDGLSEWQTMYNREEAAKMLEALMVSLRTARIIKSESPISPTVFMTYELPDGGDPLSPQALGVTAENFIAVRMINVHDQIRRIVYVLKSGTNDPDKNVRELVYKNSRAEVRTGLDLFTDLLKGAPRPADVTLQLFQENDQEKEFNEWIVSRLQKTLSLNFKMQEFSRAEISTMHEHAHENNRLSPADVTIQSVDEWWLAHAGAKAPFLDICDLWMPTGPEDLGPSWKDFWALEVRKSRARWSEGQLKPKLLAVPGYVDFGMFCVNLRLLVDNPETAAAIQLGDDVKKSVENYKTALERTEKWESSSGSGRATGATIVNAPGQTEDCSPADLNHETANIMSEAWEALLNKFPTEWTTVVEPKMGKTNWKFENTEKTTFGGLANSLFPTPKTGTAPLSPAKLWFFSFDTETRESVVCMFFELAWAFGASATFLDTTPDVREGKSETMQKADTQGATLALLWLQTMVARGWMPERATVETSRKSLFSRQFYSTLQGVSDSYFAETQIVQGSGWSDLDPAVRLEKLRDERRKFGQLPPLIAMPFFPVGAKEYGGNVESLFDDMKVRLEALLKRFFHASTTQCSRSDSIQSQYRNAIKKFSGKQPETEAEHNAAVKAILARVVTTDMKSAKTLTGLINDLIQIVKRADSNEQGTDKSDARFARELDLRDLAMVLRLNLSRIRKLLASPPAQKVEDRTMHLQADYDAGLDELSAEKYEWRADESLTPTGYCTVGSWFFGVHDATRSPSLAFDVLQELTSLDAAEHRARIGAGMPARKDFYAIHRDEPIPGMPYLTWGKFYHYCCSRTRQREKVIPDKVSPAAIYKVIQEEVHACLSHAGRNRNTPEKEQNASFNAQAKQSLEKIESAIKLASDIAMNAEKKAAEKQNPAKKQ